MNKNFYRILLYTYEDNKGMEFFNNMPPCNLYKNPDALQTIENLTKRMIKFNIWIDAIIERQGIYFLIKDTKIN